MADKHYKVEVEGDHIKRLTSSKPIPALAELIWNAFDADANRVDVEFESNELGMTAIVVADNGHGIPHNDVKALFGKLGGSWKAHGSRSKTKTRILHGKEGKGRFKALALGRVAEWTVRYRDGDLLLSYSITIIRDNLVDVRLSDAAVVDPGLRSGVSVRISELDRVYRSLEPDQSLSALAQVFALYLTDYADVSLLVDHQRVDPATMIASRQSFVLSPIIEEEHLYNAEVELIEWTSASERWIFLCGAEGFPFHRVAPSSMLRVLSSQPT